MSASTRTAFSHDKKWKEEIENSNNSLVVPFFSACLFVYLFIFLIDTQD